jgi:flagellar protein FliS
MLANAYRTVGTETGVSGGTPHKLIQMLFEGYHEALAQARGAMRERQFESKGRAIGRALRIIDEGLQAGLNMKDGGKIAADLDSLYTYVSLRLVQATASNDEASLLECAALIEPISSAWAQIAPNALAASPLKLVNA